MGRWRSAALTLSCLLRLAEGYNVPFKDDDYSRQTCSGMWAGPNTTIEVSFDSGSQGQAALIMYEWNDSPYLGKVTAAADENMPKTYVCTAEAVLYKYCDATQAGRFIVDLPAGKAMNDTSFYSARIVLGNSTANLAAAPESNIVKIPASTSNFWDNPAGNPVIPEESKKYTSPWRRALGLASGRGDGSFGPDVAFLEERTETNAEGLLEYKGPINYTVTKTGYYCVAIVPVTVRSNTAVDSTDVTNHPTYTGQVFFHNKFTGQLPATDYPKVNFYMVMFMVYAVLGGVWAWLCYKNRDDLLPIQYYLSGLVGFLVVEMIANWVYYRYLNAHGKGTGATAFLFVVAILDAGRNALSFFMLLVVSMGLSVVRENLGSTMIRCQVLTGAHFIFGVLYAVGVVELELESTSALVLLLFVIPLAFTLSGFLLWILYSLNGTITELQVRKQSYKLAMFTRLYRILWLTVAAIAVFFVASSLSFSERLAEDYAANSWKYRWWLLDGWLALLYLLTFWSIAYIWRPSSNNRYLAMSDELAQDDPEDYDMANLEGRAGRPRGPAHPDDDDDDEADAATLVGGRPGHTGRTPRDDAVVFEIGDEDGDEEDEEERKRRLRRLSGEGHEREGLMSAGGRKDE